MSSYRQGRLPKARTVVLLTVALLALGYWQLSSGGSNGRLSTYKVAVQPPASYHPEDSSSAGAPPDTAWSFDAPRDRNKHSLSLQQCHIAFPDLYYEIDRAADYWTKRQGRRRITQEQIDLGWSSDGGLRVMIYDQQLYIIYSRGLNHFLHWKERSMATLHQIQRTILSSPEPVPNIEFSIKINDNITFTESWPKVEDSTVWVFSRNIHDPVQERVWVIPDFNFYTYPRVSGSFADYQRQALEVGGDDFAGKADQLVWRGTAFFNPTVREPLLQQTAGRTWSDVRNLNEVTSSEEEQKRYRITMPEHCKYKFAVHTEGTTWSGRLKYLLSCHSVVFTHPLTYFTHLYHLLEPSGPKQNYVAAKADWTDLPDLMEELLADPAQAQLIADNAAEKFRDRYFTPAAQTCYWRQLFQTWSEIAFEPDPYEHRNVAPGASPSKRRGMTYEEYVFWDGNVPEDAR